MKAVILCAGKGTRMGFIGEHTPKSLLKVNGKNLLERWFVYFKKYGITDICINTFHLAEKIEKEIGDGSKFGVKVHWYRQPKVMGTASVLKEFNLQNEKEPFVVVFGDTMMTFDMNKLLSFHKNKNAEATILVKKHDEPWRKGVVTLNEDSRVIDIVEKPLIKKLGENQYCVHIISIIEPKTLSCLEGDQEWLVEHFFTKLVNTGHKVFADNNEELSDDVNTPEDLERLEAYLTKLEGKAQGVSHEKHL